MMSVFVWGACGNGQLGLGGIEEEFILVPKPLESLEATSPVADISCGLNHSVLRLENGAVLTSGSCEFGQLGREGACRRFQKVPALAEAPSRQVGCGSHFSVSLSTSGEVHSWGSNTHGQLGREDKADREVRLVKGLRNYMVVHVACGGAHALCLTRGSEVFAWGDNEDGQLGLGLRNVKTQPAPVRVTSLHSLAVRQLAAGGGHSVCLSVSGAVFCWGRNSFGQLGLGDTSSRVAPAQVASLKSQPVGRVSCGEAHTALLTRDGGVFTCGAGGCGQLGHNSRHNVLVPTKVFEFMGRDVAQLVCGRRHSMALVVSTGRLMTFGLGASGQLGVGHSGDLLTPSPTKGPWVPLQRSSLTYERRLSIPDASAPSVVWRAFGGLGDSSFLVAVAPDAGVQPVDERETEAGPPIDFLSADDKALLPSRLAKASAKDDPLLAKTVRVLNSIPATTASFLTDDHFNITSRNHGLDVGAASEFFQALAQVPTEKGGRVAVTEAVVQLLAVVRQRNFPSAECLRVFLLLPEMLCLFREDSLVSLVTSYCRAVHMLDPAPKKYLERWWSLVPMRCVHRVVNLMKDCCVSVIRQAAPSTSRGATARTLPDPVWNEDSSACLDAFAVLFRANGLRDEQLRKERFYIAQLSDVVDIPAEYYHWIHRNRSRGIASLCGYPFIFDGIAKSQLLQIDARIQMARAMNKAQSSNLVALFTNAICAEPPVLAFRIRRDHILEDTVTSLDMVERADLKKPLKIVFDGEEAQDEGGVRKEYLMLFFRELMDPNFAMFKFYEDSRMLWFYEYTFEDPRRFALVGTMCGLSIYNSSLVGLNFPLALYKKLLSAPVVLDDLKELDPVVGRSLQSLLDYDREDFEGTFGLTFTLETECFGQSVTVDLKPNGTNVAVTNDNKGEYVDLYVDYIFNRSCKDQYKAFHDAFHNVFACERESLLTLFEPSELQTVLVGNEEFDWAILKKNTTYKGEFWADHPVITWFWQTLDEFTTTEKKKFLLFLTGSDRVPLQGMDAIKIFIQPNNAGDEYLPVAHTCFNLLDLPKYSTKDKLNRKLRTAIEQTEGFALV